MKLSSASAALSPTTPGNDRSPTWGFTTEPGATTECRLLSGSTIVHPYASCTSPKSYDLTGLPDGDYTFEIRGNGDKAEATIRFREAGTKHLSLAWAPLKKLSP